MDKYMILEAKPLTRSEVEAAIKRAHQLRSEETWTVFVKVGSWISKLFHSNATSGSGLAHSS